MLSAVEEGARLLWLRRYAVRAWSWPSGSGSFFACGRALGPPPLHASPGARARVHRWLAADTRARAHVPHVLCRYCGVSSIIYAQVRSSLASRGASDVVRRIWFF